jgi:outer membrane protein
MNRSLILVFLMFFATCAYSQTSSGNMMVGGAIEFSSRSYQSGSANNSADVYFSPGFGYFISDNLAVGAGLSLSSWRTGTGAAKSVTSSFGFSPFARYYKFTSNESFAFFGEAVLSVSTSKTDPPSGNITRGNGIRFAISPGAAYFFNEHWAMELSMSLFSINSFDPDTDNGDDKVTTVSFGVDSFASSIGLRYHF